jgi:hypothetical protein
LPPFFVFGFGDSRHAQGCETAALKDQLLGLRYSDFIRHSTFVIGHFLKLSAGSLGCGNDFVEAWVTAQRIPARIEAEIAVCRR